MSDSHFHKSYVLGALLVLAIVSVILSYVMQQQKQTGVVRKGPVNNGVAVQCYTDADCVVAGCSSTLCLPRDQASQAVTTCEFRPEYACYSQDACGCSNNACRWSQTEQFARCVANLDGDRCQGLSGEQLQRCQTEPLGRSCQGVTGDAYINCLKQL